jgi:ubiquinone/menaquinone biosynthesis C-methylase UbiE
MDERVVNGKQRFFDEHAPSWENGRRDDALLEDLVAAISLEPGDFVVEPGCGTGLVSELLLQRIGENGRLLAFDISPKMIAQARDKIMGPQVEFRVADAGAVPLESTMADAVVCVRVFPHLDNQPLALSEFNRVLKSGGLLTIGHTAGREMLNEYHARVGGEVAEDMIPDEPGMRALLADSGFELLSIEDREERYLVIARKRT